MYNEREGIGPFLDTLTRTLSEISSDFEVICIDDGSVDDTSNTVVAYMETSSAIRLIELSRHFGKEAALAAGLSEARGRAVAFIDADLQHPPELLTEMYRHWKNGADVVECIKQNRGDESFRYRLSSRVFNYLLGRTLGKDVKGASDFKLLDRQVVDALIECRERNRFFRGLVTWVGFKVVQLPFDVPPRRRGKTSWTTMQLIRFAAQNVVSFSALPLKLVSSVGVIALVLSTGLGIQTLYRFFSGSALGGFTTVILLQLILNGLILASIGVVAIYVKELYDEAKARPVFLIRKQHHRNHDV